MDRSARKVRVPRKGDRVRFWEFDGSVRSQQTGRVLGRAAGGLVRLEIDGRKGTYATRIREMEIL